jgi:hypothetical protein
MSDKLELTEHAVDILNSIKLLPHYTLPVYVTPGHTRLTPMKLWTVEQLKDAGAIESSAFLWTRHTLAAGG